MRSTLLATFALLALALAACTALPVTQGDLDDQLASQQDLYQQSLVEAERGNETTAALLAAMSGITGIFTTIGLSRSRRSRAALTKTTGSPVPPSLMPSMTPAT